jgi:hypothetical protein
MSDAGLKRPVVLFDELQHPHIVRQQNTPAAGAAMTRGVEGENFITLFQQGGNISIEGPGRGFEAMGDQYFFQGRGIGLEGVGIGQPAMAADGMSFEAEGQPFTGGENIGVFSGCFFLWCAKKTEGLDGCLPDVNKRKDI